MKQHPTMLFKTYLLTLRGRLSGQSPRVFLFCLWNKHFFVHQLKELLRLNLKIRLYFLVSFIRKMKMNFTIFTLKIWSKLNRIL